MEFTTKEKINVLISYVEDICELKNRVKTTDLLMDIFTYDEAVELISKFNYVNKCISSIIDRLKHDEIVEKISEE